MSSSSDLMGVGVPAEVAKRSGYDLTPVTTTGSAQAATGGNLRGPGNKVVAATITTGGDSVTMPSDSGLTDDIIVSNMSGANAAVVFPHVGGNINGGTTNASVALAANTSRRFVKITALKWASWISG
jgi:hypothetical protein